jgi:polyhydroxybutyrate depolymerase
MQTVTKPIFFRRRKLTKAIVANACCGWMALGSAACSDSSNNTTISPIDGGAQSIPSAAAGQSGLPTSGTGGQVTGSPAAAGNGGAGSKANTTSVVQPRAGAAAPGKDAGAATKDASVSTKDAATADASAPEVQKCPASATALKAGNSTGSLSHGGQNRSYLVHVPATATGKTPIPLVIDLHGYSSDGAGQEGISGWNALADKEGFIVVYPNGIGSSWNVDDTCCGTAGTDKVDDVGFIKAVIKRLSEQTCIDKNRIYASGLSNGGGFAHRLGCDAADVIAAIAPVSTDLRTEPCTPARPISVMAFRGTSDTLEPYEGGVVGPSGGQYTSPGAKGSLELWRKIDQCTGTPTAIDQNCESYTACADGVEADLCSMPNVGHVPYSSFSVIETAWKMFKRQPMK